MNGYLLADKPTGMSSYDVIRRIKKLFPDQKLKIGHAGTLDPLASGLLIILIGRATKQADQFLKLDKEYVAEITLGAVSKTDDAEGPITQFNQTQPTNQQISAVLKKFMGQIEQIPPAHSAIKIGGQRAYKLARGGQEPGLSSRQVTIHDLKLLDYHYPVLKIATKVSSGTYIRSLARDIGQALGTGAYLGGLRRTKIDKWTVDKAVKIDALSAENIRSKLVMIAPA